VNGKEFWRKRFVCSGNCAVILLKDWENHGDLRMAVSSCHVKVSVPLYNLASLRLLKLPCHRCVGRWKRSWMSCSIDLKLRTFRDNLLYNFSGWHTLENGNDKLSRNVCNYQSTLRNTPEERRYHLYRGGKVISLKPQCWSLSLPCKMLRGSGLVRLRESGINYAQLKLNKEIHY
jgi:hypothetical protein